MKKTLAIVLTLLVAFSMFTVVASAEGETEGLVTVKFAYVTETDSDVLETIHVAPGTVIATEEYVPVIPTEFKRVVKNEDGSEKELKYVFKGWKSSVNGSVYYPAQLPTVAADAAAGTEITYTAEYSITDVTDTQSFWEFIASLFARLNILFEYFATIFKF